MTAQPRLPALDGLRALAILLVAISHFGDLVDWHWVPGSLGVTIFFFISGFIITRLLLGEIASTGRLDLRAFYIRRMFRLAPAMLVFIGVSCAALAAVGVTISGGSVAAALLYVANYYAIFSTTPPLDTFAVVSPLAVLWSLAVEEHFYLLFPAVLILYRKSPVALTRALTAFVVASLLWRCWLAFGVGLANLPGNRILMATDTRLDSIAYGCLLSVLVFRAGALRDGGWARRLDAGSQPAMVVAGLALLVLSLTVRNAEFKETLRYSLQGLALVPLFCALFWKLAPMVALRAVLENPSVVFFGALSYSFYLYHLLGLALVKLLWPDALPWVKVLATSGLGLAMALVSYHVVETPSRRLGGRWAASLRTATAPEPRLRV